MLPCGPKISEAEIKKAECRVKGWKPNKGAWGLVTNLPGEEDIKEANCSDIIKARMEGEGLGGAVGLSKVLREEKKNSSGLFFLLICVCV